MDEVIFTEELSDKKKHKKEQKVEKEVMASERTMLAFERTLLAWVRTATHLMTFGFAIYKLLDEKRLTPGSHKVLEYISPKTIGLIMIGSGMIGLCIAVYRYTQIAKKYGKLEPKTYYAPVMVQAYIIIALCIIMIAGSMIPQ